MASSGSSQPSSRRTTGHDDNFRNDDEDVIYVRPKPTPKSGHFKTEAEAEANARSESNQLAYQIKTSGHFHDVKVIVTDFDKERKDREDFDRRYNEKALDRAREDKKRQDTDGRKTEKDIAIEREKEKKQEENRRLGKQRQIDRFTQELRNKGMQGDALREGVDKFLEKLENVRLGKEKANMDAKQAKARKLRDEAYIREVEKKPDRVEILLVPNRPGMAAAIAVGAQVQGHSSMKGKGKLNRHRAVQEALDQLGSVERLASGLVELHPKLDKLGKPVGKIEPWHGQCAEVGAVSDYLHSIDQAGRMTLEQAKAHFQKKKAVSFAHRPSLSDGTPATELKAEVPACGSCTFMLKALGIRHRSP